jgi:hypothetical protein
MRDREEVRLALDRNYKRLMDCMGQLTEEELTSDAILGTWTVKDVLAHVWAWGDEAVQTAKAWNKPRPWQEGVEYGDAWNDTQVKSRHGLPFINVVDGITGVHRRLMHILDEADDSALSQVGRTPRGEEMSLLDFLHEMAIHYEEHFDALVGYQTRCLGSQT